MTTPSKILCAILVLALASLACQTLSGGSGGNAPELPASSDDGGDEVIPPPSEGGEGGGESDFESEFPIPEGAMNVQEVGGSLNFQVKMTLDEAMKFYMDAFAAEGYTERALLTVTSETTFSMVFDGHESGKAIVVQGVDFGEGTVNVNVRLEDA